MLNSTKPNWNTCDAFISIDSVNYSIRKSQPEQELFAGHLILGTLIKDVIRDYGNAFVGGRNISRVKCHVPIDSTQDELLLKDFYADLKSFLIACFWQADTRTSNTSFNVFQVIRYAYSDYNQFIESLVKYSDNYSIATSGPLDLRELETSLEDLHEGIEFLLDSIDRTIEEQDDISELIDTLIDKLFEEQLIIAVSVVPDISTEDILLTLDEDKEDNQSLFHALRISFSTIEAITGKGDFRISSEELQNIMKLYPRGLGVPGLTSDTILLPHIVYGERPK